MLPSISIHTTQDDVKYALYNQPEVVSDVIKNDGVWNHHVLEMADKILSKNPGPGKVYDIGAGIGTFCIPLAIKYNDRFGFFAFEAQRLLALQLSTNIFLNNLDCITVHNCIIAGKNDSAHIPSIDVQFSSNHQALSLDKKINDARGIPFEEVEDTTLMHPTDVRTLESYPDKNLKLVKISVCGMELDVIEGAISVFISNDFPPVIFETWQELDWYKRYDEKICNSLTAIGYEYIHDMGSHKIAFKNSAEFNFYMQEDTVSGQLGEFMIAEHEHDAQKTIEHQAFMNMK
jgi:FkbM family methyltransferase